MQLPAGLSCIHHQDSRHAHHFECLHLVFSFASRSLTQHPTHESKAKFIASMKSGLSPNRSFLKGNSQQTRREIDPGGAASLIMGSLNSTRITTKIMFSELSVVIESASIGCFVCFIQRWRRPKGRRKRR